MKITQDLRAEVQAMGATSGRAGGHGGEERGVRAGGGKLYVEAAE